MGLLKRRAMRLNVKDVDVGEEREEEREVCCDRGG